VSSLRVETTIERTQSVRGAAVQQAHSLREKIAAWAEYADYDVTESLLEKADRLEIFDSDRLVEMEQL